MKDVIDLHFSADLALYGSSFPFCQKCFDHWNVELDKSACGSFCRQVETLSQLLCLKWQFAATYQCLWTCETTLQRFNTTCIDLFKCAPCCVLNTHNDGLHM